MFQLIIIVQLQIAATSRDFEVSGHGSLPNCTAETEIEHAFLPKQTCLFIHRIRSGKKNHVMVVLFSVTLVIINLPLEQQL